MKSIFLITEKHWYWYIYASISNFDKKFYVFKYLLSSIFWVLLKPFLEWFNSFGSTIKLLPLRDLYFETLMFCSFNESLVKNQSYSNLNPLNSFNKCFSLFLIKFNIFVLQLWIKRIQNFNIISLCVTFKSIYLF